MDSETTYSLVRTWFGTGGLILMVVLFAVVLAYALWPSNKKKFDRMAKLPLEDKEPGDSGKKDTETGE
ncbi:cbb3-type cytochrome c oxidase subunit 3 [Parvibaculum sp.]|uniref:cbb3-type cytochrome c oxidase subunit 3 n=1 Tax=Parvibaculum sp. TaxID=2024848 RepID=UPI001B100C33|nr:cbb3-type cytochrome c oxidase subunit 3 [Parvibaculum sp.]MBO6635025.1 cbb3-type cytochrome c oxidase subunit 3 [Parvibaculum sp.]MBO6677178.1 cbb3-type cytochrome c oxidase subunit 3 [Parvibaculum sp.]MBO6685161.1 cbb3-type cytochrome c oxidase subunit 3 [Parvibaculum sp.]MBO6904735.1 cbb3-type cytochrome c oxidase subunit 3 [Parvibaculum sp.]